MIPKTYKRNHNFNITSAPESLSKKKEISYSICIMYAIYGYFYIYLIYILYLTFVYPLVWCSFYCKILMQSYVGFHHLFRTRLYSTVWHHCDVIVHSTWRVLSPPGTFQLQHHQQQSIDSLHHVLWAQKFENLSFRETTVIEGISIDSL